MTIHLANHRTASIRVLPRWDFGCRKFATCYILQFGPVWLSIDRKRKSSNNFRIRPEPTMVELGPDDIDLHNDLFRRLDRTGAGTAHGMDDRGIWLGCERILTNWRYLRSDFLRSTDKGKTWKRCEKEAVSTAWGSGMEM